jgi:signal transduction histidine kinase
VLAVLMAASSFISGMMFLFQARGFMLITAAPAAVCLLAMPFLPYAPGPSDALQGAIGAGCGVAGFLAYVFRAAVHNTSMVNGLRAANKQAKERQAEAEAKRAEAEEANRAKSEFLAVMTHELRTPLNAVIGYAEIIQEDMQAEGRRELANDAGRISGSARHLLGLIDQILNMASVDAGHEGIFARDIDVREVIDAHVQLLDKDARAHGNRISLRVAPGAERATTDGDKLGLCVGALISNAVKFTENGLVAITAEAEDAIGGPALVVTVSDTGVGIAAEDLPRIFKPFTQLDATATRSKGGMGLGLSIAQRMAHALGGDLSVTSELGKGSTFVLRVPLRMSTPMANGVRAAA